MNYYNEIKNKIIDNEVYLKVKDYSKERHKVINESSNYETINSYLQDLKS